MIFFFKIISMSLVNKTKKKDSTKKTVKNNLSNIHLDFSKYTYLKMLKIVNLKYYHDVTKNIKNYVCPIIKPKITNKEFLDPYFLFKSSSHSPKKFNWMSNNNLAKMISRHRELFRFIEDNNLYIHLLVYEDFSHVKLSKKNINILNIGYTGRYNILKRNVQILKNFQQNTIKVLGSLQIMRWGNRRKFGPRTSIFDNDNNINILCKGVTPSDILYIQKKFSCKFDYIHTFNPCRYQLTKEDYFYFCQKTLIANFILVMNLQELGGSATISNIPVTEINNSELITFISWGLLFYSNVKLFYSNFMNKSFNIQFENFKGITDSQKLELNSILSKMKLSILENSAQSLSFPEEQALRQKFKPFSFPNKIEIDFRVIPLINNFKSFVRKHFNNYHQFINNYNHSYDNLNYRIQTKMLKMVQMDQFNLFTNWFTHKFNIPEN